jgi:hypothetical protein
MVSERRLPVDFLCGSMDGILLPVLGLDDMIALDVMLSVFRVAAITAATVT